MRIRVRESKCDPDSRAMNVVLQETPDDYAQARGQSKLRLGRLLFNDLGKSNS